MKNILTILLFSSQVFVYGQRDSVKNALPYFKGPDYSKTIFPLNDGLTYDQYVGETIAGYNLAEGWRIDAINGGFNKKMYSNPYIASQGDFISFEKIKSQDILKYYLFKKGKRFTGKIRDTLELSYSHPRGGGIYYFVRTSYESRKVKIIFQADCVNGLIHGEGTLTDFKANKLISKCNFDNGEVVGKVTTYGLLSNNIFTTNYKKGSAIAVSRTETDQFGNKIEPDKELTFTETYQTLVNPYAILKQSAKANQTYIDNLQSPIRFSNPLFLEPLSFILNYFDQIRKQTPDKNYQTNFFEVSEFKYEDYKIVFISFKQRVGNSGAVVIECFDKKNQLIMIRYQNVSHEDISTLDAPDYTNFFHNLRSGYNLTTYQYDDYGKIVKASKYVGLYDGDVNFKCDHEDFTKEILSYPGSVPFSIISWAK